MALRIPARPSENDGVTPSKRGFAGQIALFTGARTILNTYYRMVYPFLSVFARGLGVDLTSLSLVLTARSLMGFLSPFLAPIADRRGRKVSMLLGLGLMTASALLIAVFPSYGTFFGGMMLATLGNLIFIPAMQAFVGDFVPYAKRGRALGITELSWSFAFIAGIPLVGWLIETAAGVETTSALAWRAPFPVIAAFGVLAMILIAWRVPNTTAQSQSRLNGWQSFGNLLTIRPVLAGLGFAIAISVANEVINLVFGVWLEDRFALKLAALGAASAVIGISELGGEGFSALFVDRLGKHRAVRIGLLVSSMATILLYALGSRVFGALTGLFFFYLGFEFTIVSSLPLLSEVQPQTRATFMALVIASFSFGRAIGALLAPWLYRWDFLANLVCALLFNAVGFILLSAVHHSEE